MFWDTPDPYHYSRLRKSEHGNSDLLIVGGEDHKTGQADNFDERFERLEEWTRERFPKIESFEYRWSGQIMKPVDGLAFIGEHPAGRQNVYLASGDSGHGMTHGTIAGLVLRDLILGRPNPWSRLYDPSWKSDERACQQQPGPSGKLSCAAQGGSSPAGKFSFFKHKFSRKAVQPWIAGWIQVSSKIADLR